MWMPGGNTVGRGNKHAGTEGVSTPHVYKNSKEAAQLEWGKRWGDL